MSESLITKKAIAQALKNLCRDKAFDKISIADITTACGLNRQTFYYHFQDKYELLSWIFYNENFSIITDDISFENWDKKFLEMLQIMQAEKTFYMNTLKEQEHTFESYLFEMAKTLFLEAIEALDRNKKLELEEKEFDAEFYAYGICGVIVSWAQRGMKIPPETVAYRLKRLVRDSEKAAYMRSREVLELEQNQSR